MFVAAAGELRFNVILDLSYLSSVFSADRLISQPIPIRCFDFDYSYHSDL
jgi:hypothetical protein